MMTEQLNGRKLRPFKIVDKGLTAFADEETRSYRVASLLGRIEEQSIGFAQEYLLDSKAAQKMI